MLASIKSKKNQEKSKKLLTSIVALVMMVAIGVVQPDGHHEDIGQGRGNSVHRRLGWPG